MKRASCRRRRRTGLRRWQTRVCSFSLPSPGYSGCGGGREEFRRVAPASRWFARRESRRPLARVTPARMPSPGDSISTTALSVSISSKGSPLDYALAFFFAPRQDFPGLLGHFERGHDDADGHGLAKGAAGESKATFSA